MGVAYYPSFERKIEGFDLATAVNGKPIARAMDRLDEIAKGLGITALRTFHSESKEEFFSKIGESVPPGLPDHPVQWSEPEHGIRTLVALIKHLRDHPDELPNAARVCEDLESFRQVLLKAQEHETRFRLCIDI
jgi:hypothetical protein